MFPNLSNKNSKFNGIYKNHELIILSSNLKMLFSTIKRTKKWMKTICLSLVISLSICLYLRIYQENLIPLFLPTTIRRSQNTYPCVSFCALEHFDELYEEPLTQNTKNIKRDAAHNYLMLWWNGNVCKETLLSINFTEVRIRFWLNFVQTCIPSTSITKNCNAINLEAPWDYLEPLCYTLSIPQKYEDTLQEPLRKGFAQ